MNKNKLLEYSHLFGLIGYPIAHSFSKKYFSDKFLNQGIENCFYELFPLKTIDSFPTLISGFPNLIGLNVTIPYKEQVIPFLDELDESAAQVGAVNTIKIDGGKCIGYNTDVYGFETSLIQFLKKSKSNKVKNALVFGTGGASKAVKFVLNKLEIDFKVVSRDRQKGDLRYDDLHAKTLRDFQLLINTTPLGMAPNIASFPKLDYDALNSNHFLFDLVYNPEKTVFLTKGEKLGCSVMNGLPMLYLQAEKAWVIWNQIIAKK